MMMPAGKSIEFVSPRKWETVLAHSGKVLCEWQWLAVCPACKSHIGTLGLTRVPGCDDVVSFDFANGYDEQQPKVFSCRAHRDSDGQRDERRSSRARAFKKLHSLNGWTKEEMKFVPFPKDADGRVALGAPSVRDFPVEAICYACSFRSKISSDAVNLPRS